jgi:hypothetical protein
MEDRGISITSEENKLIDTGALTNPPIAPMVIKSLALIAVVTSIYAFAGTTATLNTETVGINKLESMVSVTDFKNVENQLKKRDYSFITAMGFEDDSVSFPDMFI